MSTSRDELEALVGQTIGEKYLLQRLLGVGGMGAVFEAKNIGTGRRVALKLMLAALAQHKDQVERFLREARAAAKIEHPNIVQVLDVGQSADGSFYLVQEFLRGRDLRSLLDERSVLAPSEVRSLLAPVMSALAAAHKLGVVHRDIKPDNIFVAEQSTGERLAKVIDFGIAKLTEAGPENLSVTRTGTAIGTPLYMSPEQARGERSIDGQTDVWSLGVVMFEALSGSTPFSGESYNEVLAKILTLRAPRLDEIAQGISSEIAAVVAKSLEPSRAHRYRSMDEFLAATMSAEAFAGHRVATVIGRPSVRPDAATIDASAPRSHTTEARATVEERVAPPVARETATAAAPERNTVSAPVVQVLAKRQRAPSGTAVIAVIAAVLLVSVVGGLTARKSTAREGAPREARVTVIAAVTDAGVPVARGASAPTELVIAMTASPSSAVIEVDGQRSIGAFAGRFAVDGSVRRVRVSAPGYVAREFSFVDRAPEGRVVLERAAGAAGARVLRSNSGNGGSTTTAGSSARREGPMQREYE